MENTNQPRYVISVAAEILGMQTYTLRYYERVGIIKPFRSQGRIRLYSEQDIERLKLAKTLLDELGINMAGVEVILNMRNRIQELMSENEALKEEIQLLREE
ncbi:MULTISPECIES: MerR family transcriptional regulator [Dehalococcoides]|jgi:MerR family transcriptional regulator/heat shock protein HspR|uniref:HspR, transcriptional repressor of DnaK operon n=2 Tax=Dehalococcoides mccartyi TaxID=61435 RepID=A0A142VB79_9CHLR|nr:MULTISPECIES: helix-turn-helix transcriptional regulator [Dehalococcoides]AGG06868.1 transcriptional regulator, MerR family [Dehalococcoides mccartyi DCMB5]AGG08363.1 transcriptional regulator, MerR family [Dehalococcoides mccartyi BTF08]AII61366.1 MerR family transcriptional regulator [Dehalococcoides mccartyi CG5]AMU87068.1 MerR family transcriptional regulator [Dehalococcoides mccartyi]AOV99854.1 HspR, transcriptional repressor of DnaK operon [Dehalococcoides mccartyi]